MSLEKILIIGVALLIMGGVYTFANGVQDANNKAGSNAATAQGTFDGTVKNWTWGAGGG